MVITEDYKNTHVIAKKTLALIEERGIRPTPHNYAIWFEYLQETNPDLTRAVNDLLSKNGRYSEKLGIELFKKFFTREHEGRVIQETNRLVQKSMDNVMGDLKRTTADISTYGEQLNDFAVKAGEVNGQDLERMINEIVDQTNSMSDNSSHLQHGLDSASREIAELKRRLQYVQKEAYTDSLTGIPNRKSFDALLSKEIAAAREKRSGLCLMMADIDHFKKFNDLHGHTFGDQVIKLVASTLAKGTEKNAVAARYGGEEFSVILPATDLADAVNIANDLRMAIAAKRLVERSTKKDVGKITMSFGVTTYAHPEGPTAFINRADQALYSAKKAGRNCVKHLQPSTV
ncbi:GGDEF domain-containing protein [Sneathiella sp.]|uniref:GGDEF domain-containing protein n=1 Tax=Sneathiella sp. TaxID=1964365 RepID=UPI00263574C0|nr:GGDEF domain-containing protein [Sneathiella sp.]MDF2368292.1 GGDEF domain-containing protein [Sneathiella sp.]